LSNYYEKAIQVIVCSEGLVVQLQDSKNGYEYIVRFADAGTWTTDPESYYSKLPSKYNIDAIEPSEVIMFNRDDFEALKQMIPALTTFSEIVITTNASLIQKRVLMNISANAKEKYIDFINSFPDIFIVCPCTWWHLISAYQEKHLPRYAKRAWRLRTKCEESYNVLINC